MKVDDAFYHENCARCLDNAKPDGKHVMCLTVSCKRLDRYLANAANLERAEKEQEENAEAEKVAVAEEKAKSC